MRHRIVGRTLGRNASHRLALFRNLSRALIEHGRIITTVEKAKELRPFVERLVTLARKARSNGGAKALHYRRLLLARLPDKDAVRQLIDEYGERFANRPGGYTRILKRHERRLGDAGRTAFIEFLKADEAKPAAEAPAPVAPTVAGE
jgi:large subunit ribosomal protein L17